MIKIETTTQLPMYKLSQLPKLPHICIFGKTQEGKSYFSRWLFDKYKKRYKIIILDSKNEYGKLYDPLKLSDFKLRGFVRRINQVVIGSNIITDLGKVMEILAGLVLSVKYSILVIEEAPMILKKTYKDLYGKFPNTARLLFQGNATHQHLICIAQSPVNLQNDCIRQSSEIYSFKMEPVDQMVSPKYLGYHVEWDLINQHEYSFWSKNYDRIYHKVGSRTKKKVVKKDGK